MAEELKYQLFGVAALFLEDFRRIAVFFVDEAHPIEHDDLKLLGVGYVILLIGNAVMSGLTSRWSGRGDTRCFAPASVAAPLNSHVGRHRRRTMEIAILEATISDAAEILALQKRAYLSEVAIYDDYHIPPLTQTQSKIEAEFNDNVFLKALSSGSMVGSVRARNILENCEISRLIVEPECQGCGIGKRLMAAIEARFDFVDWFVLFTGHRSERNLRLYEQIGYHRFRTEQIALGLDFVHLRKANGQS